MEKARFAELRRIDGFLLKKANGYRELRDEYDGKVEELKRLEQEAGDNRRHKNFFARQARFYSRCYDHDRRSEDRRELNYARADEAKYERLMRNAEGKAWMLREDLNRLGEKLRRRLQVVDLKAGGREG